MYHKPVNDGKFYYNKLIFGLSANLLDNRLKLKGNAIFSMNRFKSAYRPARSNDWRADFTASYMMGDFLLRASYALPYSVLGIDGAKVSNPAQYGLSLSWKRGSWAAECCFENIFHRRMAVTSGADYIAGQFFSRSLRDLKGRNIALTLTYTLPYGKQTDREEIQTETKINSAIIRPF